MEDREKRDRADRKGIRLGTFHSVVAAVIAVLAVILFLSSFLTRKGFSRMTEATEQYITAQQAAANMQAASDYLTAEARAFVVTGELRRAENFFEEIEVTRRRDRALEEIQEFMDDLSSYTYLSAAMDSSNALLSIEFYAMRLAAESYGYDPAVCPEQLGSVTLTDADLALSPEAQRDRALELLFDETYQNYKDEVRGNVALSVEVLIEKTREQQLESSAKLLQLIRREEILVAAMLVLALVLVVSTYYFVSRPLRKYIGQIQSDEKLTESGARELRFLARTYNEVREQNLSHREQLRYDATHDALTGVFNRSVFEKLRSRFSMRDNALLIVDLDRFKTINDQYGHDVGDRALCCVSALLQENFRAEDYICRIGGDEFAVIMVHADSSMRGLIAGKIARINELLQKPQEGLPPLSLSVGGAFGDASSTTGDLFKDADTALYRAKNSQQEKCEFFG